MSPYDLGMASLFRMPGKPYWYLRVKISGVWSKRSTGLRHDCPNDTAKARELRAKAEAAEFRRVVAAQSAGWEWVPNHLGHGADRTVEKYLGSWKWVAMWLDLQKITIESVRYAHVHEYIDWRCGRRKRNTGKSAGKNTAIQEVKLLANVLNEAVRRGIIAANPLASLRLTRDPTPLKREFTDPEIDKCRKLLAHEPEWMRVAFEVALQTGCRLRETRIPMDCIDLAAVPPTITFPHPKGGEKKAFTVPCPQGLVGMFQKMKNNGQAFTIEAFPFQPSRAWQHFFRRAGVQGVCFHCLRVTKVTRMRREGVPREVAMRLVNHSSELIHQLYDRHQVQDLARWANCGIAGSAVSK
jgi:integrase